MIVRFHPAAQEELVESAQYYEAVRPGVGVRFRDAVRTALDHIIAHPEIGAPRLRARRVKVKGFPYDLVYRVIALDIEVLALAHRSRRPGYWRRRV